MKLTITNHARIRYLERVLELNVGEGGDGEKIARLQQAGMDLEALDSEIL